MRIAITELAFDPVAEIAAFEASDPNSGALATFVGRCRPQSNGRAVRLLELQHYAGFTEAVVGDFATRLATEMQIHDIAIIHRVGIISPGEAIVLVAVSSDHRAEALHAVEVLIDFLKTDAPFWKHETTDAGARWIEPTAGDYDRRRASGQRT